MLLASSNNRISGIVTFNGGNAKALGQVIPVLSIADLGVAKNDPNIGGMTGNQNSSVNIYKSNGSIRTPETDPRIKLNIMNYSLISIDGISLKQLWENNKIRILTKGQINLMLNQINLQ